MRSGSPPTLWCDLIVTEGPPVKETDLDHIGIERALRQERRRRAALCELLRLRLERLDEEPADRLALRLRIANAVERGEERVRGVDVHERDVVVAAEERHDLLRLVQPHQPVVDEDAGELVADRLVDQHRRDGGIDAAGEPADHPPPPDLFADALDRLVLELRHGPVAGKPGDLAHEILDQPRTVRRVHDLRMEHQPVELALLVLDQREGRVLRRAAHAKSPAAAR